MSGNPDNASLWAEADVYIAPLGTEKPATVEEEFGGDWGQVGILDGDDGFVESREEDKEDKFGWGGILIRTPRKNFKLTKKFSALEDNEVTRKLVWPGSPVGKIVIPRPVPVLVAFETREFGKIRRLITSRHAEIDVDGDITENETDLTKYELLATIFPTAAGELFDEQKSEVVVGG